jgi:hypothetical protein
MVPETKERFVQPSDVKGKEARICPIETPFILPGKNFWFIITLNEFISEFIRIKSHNIESIKLIIKLILFYHFKKSIQ